MNAVSDVAAILNAGGSLAPRGHMGLAAGVSAGSMLALRGGLVGGEIGPETGAHVGQVDPSRLLPDRSVLGILRRLKYHWLFRAIFGEHDDRQETLRKFHLLCAALTQTGKTALLHEMALMIMYSGRRITPIIVLENSNGSFLQHEERWNGPFTRHIATLLGDGVLPFGRMIPLVGATFSDLKNIFESHGVTGVPIMLANPSQIAKLRSFLHSGMISKEDSRFVLLCDESDLNQPRMGSEPGRSVEPPAPEPAVQTQESVFLRYVPPGRRTLPPAPRVRSIQYRTRSEDTLEDLYEMACGVVEMTATGATCMAAANITHVARITPVPPAQGFRYHGARDITYVAVPPARKAVSGRARIWSSRRNAEALERIFRGTDLTSEEGMGRPGRTNGILNEPQARLLMKCGTAIEEHAEVIEWCKTQDGPPITVVEHNREHIRVHLPRNHVGCRNGPVVSEFPSVFNTEGRVFTISSVTQMLKEEHEENPALHNHIVYVSGLKAERGTSFVSSDFGWHLTHMYFACSASASMSNLVQSVGRLTGMYRDDPRLVLFSEVETIRDYLRSADIEASMYEGSETSALHGSVVREENGTLHMVGPDDQRIFLPDGEVDRRWGALNRSRRFEHNIERAPSWSGSPARRKDIHEALRLHPDAQVIDHLVPLEGYLDESTRRRLFEIVHRQGTPGRGRKSREHFVALGRDAAPGIPCPLESMKSALESAARAEFAVMEARYGARYAWPDFVSFDPLLKNAEGHLRGGLLVEDVSAAGGSGKYRYHNHRHMTKGRNGYSSSGQIEYMSNTAFMTSSTDGCPLGGISGDVYGMEFYPGWKASLIVRMVPNEDLVLEETREGDIVRRVVSGYTIGWTAERNVQVRRGGSEIGIDAGDRSAGDSPSEMLLRRWRG